MRNPIKMSRGCCEGAHTAAPTVAPLDWKILVNGSFANNLAGPHLDELGHAGCALVLLHHLLHCSLGFRDCLGVLPLQL